MNISHIKANFLNQSVYNYLLPIIQINSIQIIMYFMYKTLFIMELSFNCGIKIMFLVYSKFNLMIIFFYILFIYHLLFYINLMVYHLFIIYQENPLIHQKPNRKDLNHLIIQLYYLKYFQIYLNLDIF